MTMCNHLPVLALTAEYGMQADLAGEAVLSEILAQIRDTLEAALCLEGADRNGSSKNATSHWFRAAGVLAPKSHWYPGFIAVSHANPETQVVIMPHVDTLPYSCTWAY